MLRKFFFGALIVAVLGSAAGVAYASHNGGKDSLSKARDATKQFRSLSVATGAEYSELFDKERHRLHRHARHGCDGRARREGLDRRWTALVDALDAGSGTSTSPTSAAACNWSLSSTSS